MGIFFSLPEPPSLPNLGLMGLGWLQGCGEVSIRSVYSNGNSSDCRVAIPALKCLRHTDW